jgi:hypothetical protein
MRPRTSRLIVLVLLLMLTGQCADATSPGPSPDRARWAARDGLYRPESVLRTAAPVTGTRHTATRPGGRR